MQVLLRRIIEHLRTQNWVAVLLDLVIVIVGVFIAFQVEQWYADRNLLEVEQKHLQSLREDFQQTRTSIEGMIERYRLASTVGVQLLEASRSRDILAPKDFYTLLSQSLRLGRFEVVRRTWDVLTSSGEIGVIRDDELKARIAAFFAEVDVVLANYTDWMGMFDMHDGYFIRHFDYVEYTRYFHPPELSTVRENDPPIFPIERFHSPEFRNIIVSHWHSSHDNYNRMLELSERITKIDDLIQESLLIQAGE